MRSWRRAVPGSPKIVQTENAKEDGMRHRNEEVNHFPKFWSTFSYGIVAKCSHSLSLSCLASQHPKPELTCWSQLAMPPAGTAVKTNPLLAEPSSAPPPRPHCSTGAGVSDQEAGGDRPVFYGQRRNIRKTKEREMISAISQLAQHGQWLEVGIAVIP